MCIDRIDSEENIHELVSVIRRLTQLATIRYVGGPFSNDADRAVVAAVATLTQLMRVVLQTVSLYDDNDGDDEYSYCYDIFGNYSSYYGSDYDDSDDDNRTDVTDVNGLVDDEDGVDLEDVILCDNGLTVTDAMTRLKTVVLEGVSMTAGAWDRFVTSLLTLTQSVDVELSYTDINSKTARRIRTSPNIIVTDDDGVREDGRSRRLVFTTVPSRTK